MLNKFRNWLYRFMYGRNGVDQLSNYLLYGSFIILIPTIFIRNDKVRLIFLTLFWIVVIFNYYRIFSKNTYKRQAENRWFVSKLNYLKTRITQRKNYRFYDCPKCHTHLRVPKGAGLITITCKKCGYQFDKKA